MGGAIAGNRKAIALFTRSPETEEEFEAIGDEIDRAAPQHFRVTIAAKTRETEGMIGEAGGAGNFDEVRSRVAMGGEAMRDVELRGVPDFPG